MSDYERRMGMPLQPLRYNYSSPRLRYLDRARLFPEDIAEREQERRRIVANGRRHWIERWSPYYIHSGVPLPKSWWRA